MFTSDTDTEIIVNLISYNYHEIFKLEKNKTQRIEKAIQSSLKTLKGTFGICLLNLYDPKSIYIFKNGSPITFFYNNKQLIAASEQNILQKFTNFYYECNNNRIYRFNLNNKDHILSNIDKNDKYTNKYEIEKCNIHYTPKPYQHWTLKEIYDIPFYYKLSLNNGGRIYNNEIKLGGLSKFKTQIISKKNIIFLACGSSLNAALYVSKIYRKLNIFDNIIPIEASEFDITDYTDLFINNCLFVFISQSGETYDLIRLLDDFNNKGIFNLGIVNKVGSYISKNTNCGIYINSGIENAVAATKSFINQCSVLLLLALYIKQYKHEKNYFYDCLLKNIKDISFQFLYNEQFLSNIQNISNILYTSKNMFILGSNNLYIAREGALKIKEITYTLLNLIPSDN